MNDRFKFRVWDKKNSEYVPEGEMCDVHCLLHRDGTLDCGVAYDDGYAGDIDWVKTEDAVIEQCTGLTDKNGKLIYEGDVVRDGDGIKSIVIWLHGGFYLEYKDGGLGDLASFSIDLEIIGNIHDKEVEK